jgi:hypothetical protein
MTHKPPLRTDSTGRFLGGMPSVGHDNTRPVPALLIRSIAQLDRISGH